MVFELVLRRASTIHLSAWQPSLAKLAANHTVFGSFSCRLIWRCLRHSRLETNESMAIKSLFSKLLRYWDSLSFPAPRFSRGALHRGYQKVYASRWDHCRQTRRVRYSLFVPGRG